jgi:Ricin-type beta-trefoil lectin domain
VAIPSSAYAVGDGSRTLWKNYSNQLCMGVAGGDSHVQDGTAIITWTCNGSSDQTWVLSLVDPNQPSGPYFIKNSVAESECLSVGAKSTSPGARLVLWHCKEPADNQDQQWQLTSDRQAPYNYLYNSTASLVASALNAKSGVPVALEPQSSTWFPVDAWQAG